MRDPKLIGAFSVLNDRVKLMKPRELRRMQVTW